MRFTSLLATALSIFVVTAALPQGDPNPYRPYPKPMWRENPFTYVGTRAVTFDPGYDDVNRTLESLACSSGRNGVMKRYGWQTQGDIPHFPFIGGVEAVEGWNSTNCGTCWGATFEGRRVYILAIDRTQTGINIAREAMDQLTGGEAVKLGRVFADIVRVPAELCQA